MLKLAKFGPALIVGAIASTGVSFADESVTVSPSAASYEERGPFVLSIDAGAVIEGEVDAGFATLDLDDGAVLEGSVAYRLNDRVRAGVAVSREATEINLGMASFDASLWTVKAFGEVDLYEGDDEGFYVRGGYGLSQGEVGFALGDIELSDGQTWELGAGYRFNVGDLPAHVRYAYVDTSNLDVGGFGSVEVNRHALVFGIDLG